MLGLDVKEWAWRCVCVNRTEPSEPPVDEDVMTTMTSVTSSYVDANVSLDALYMVSLSFTPVQVVWVLYSVQIQLHVTIILSVDMIECSVSQ